MCLLVQMSRGFGGMDKDMTPFLSETFPNGKNEAEPLECVCVFDRFTRMRHFRASVG